MTGPSDLNYTKKNIAFAENLISATSLYLFVRISAHDDTTVSCGKLRNTELFQISGRRIIT